MNSTWKIPVTWEMAGIVEVDKDEFPTIEEAMNYVRDESNPIGLPDREDSVYIDGSWSLSCEDVESVMLYNKKEK